MNLIEATQLLKKNGYIVESVFESTKSAKNDNLMNEDVEVSTDDWYNSNAYNELSDYIINKISAKIEEKCGNEVLKKFWNIMGDSTYMDSTLLPGQGTMEEIVNISTSKIWNTFIRKLDDNDEILTLNNNYPQGLFQTDNDEVILK